jgi:hypothetical protein
MPVPAVISGLLRALASGGKVAKNVPRADPRLLQGVTRADPRLLHCANYARSQRKHTSRAKPVPGHSVWRART